MAAEASAVRIKTDGFSAGLLEVNGVDISKAARGARVTMRAGHIPQIEVDLLVLDVEADTENTEIIIPAATREALIALGWTPPEE